MSKFKRFLRLLGLSFAALTLMTSVALAGPTSPGAGSPTTPGALCLDDADTWIFCNTSATFGDTSSRIAEGWFTTLNSTTLVLGGAVTGPILNSAGTAAAPAYSYSTDTNTGDYLAAADTLGFAAAGAEVGTWSTTALSLTNGQNLVLSGGNATGEGNIQFQSTASNLYDTNLLHVSSTAMTMGIIAGSTPVFAATNGPYIGLRGNTYSAVVTKRGNLFLAAGSPSVPLTGEGEIQFVTGADVQRMVVDKAGVVYIPTPSTNRFVAGGTASIGGQMVSIIGNTVGVGVLAIQNTTAANAGYAQLDIYNSSGTNVAGFGYGNSATVAATQDRTYFYTVAKAFHISTDSNTTRQFVIAATSGAASFVTKATAGGVAGFTYTPGAHTAVTANVTDFSVAAHTMTITGGYASQIFSSFGAPIVTAASGLTLTNVTNVNIEMASVAGSALITNNSALFLGSPAAAVTVANIAATHLSLLETGNQSFTLTAATQITNAIGVAGATFGTMTVNQSGGAVTVDNVATVYIAGALTAGGSVTLTNNYALFVDDGATRLDGNVILSKGIDTTAGDSATLNTLAGRFRKDTSGSTFTLTDSFITANSIISLTYASDSGTTGFDAYVVAGSGSAVITFTTSGVAAAPTANTDVNFLVIN